MAALVFLSFAPEDSTHRDALVTQLAPLVAAGVLEAWDASEIAAGEQRDEIVASKLAAAQVVVLLVTADYLASQPCRAEMERALADAKKGRVRVVPVLVRPCLAMRDALAGLQLLPTGGKPVTTWPDADDAWTNVAAGIQAVVDGRRPDAAGMPAWYASVVKEWQTRTLMTQRVRERLTEEVILCLARLEDARTRKRRLQEDGASTALVDAEILALKRGLRDGGKVRQGDLLAERYSLLKYIGRGGFATVWEAEDRRERRRVALKILHPSVSEETDKRERFFRGARAMAALSHPGVVRILDPEVEDGAYSCFAMELIRGGTLQSAVLEKKLPRERWLPLLLAVCDALTDAHAHGFVHRDVKPANILLDEEGSPRLTDFDLVLVENTTGGTRTGGLGTFGFAAPELLEKPQEADVRADVYGMGMTALFCVYGRKVPERDLPRALAKIEDRRLAAALRKATELRAEDRFQDMRSFRDALREAMMAHHVRRFRRWVIYPLAAAVVLSGITFRVVHSNPTRRPKNAPQCPSDMVGIPGDIVTIGSSKADKDADPDEKEHTIVLAPFCIDRTEVTVNAYRKCAEDAKSPLRCPPVPSTIHWKSEGPDIRFWNERCNGGAPERGRHPLNCVDHATAAAFCKWAGKALPSEAQWEYAARGPDRRIYPWGNEPPAARWLNACGAECAKMADRAGEPNWSTLYAEEDPWPTTAPAGEVEGDSSAFGVRDMGGNVIEWVADWMGPYPSAEGDPPHDPLQTQPEGTPTRVQRGGSWMSEDPAHVRAAYRWRAVPEQRSIEAGFRCARAPLR